MNPIIFLAVLYSSIGLLFCQQNPTIAYVTEEQAVDIGDTVALRCSVQNAADYQVNWVKVDQDNPSNHLFLSSGSSLIVPGRRLSIRYDELNSTFTLQITGFQETDSGIYQCQIIIGPTNKLTSDVGAFVKTPPVISENSTRSVIKRLGENVTLHCYATGIPTPRVSWRRENNELLSTGRAVHEGNELTILNITKDDRGTYFCIADNGVGRGGRRVVSVDVEFAPVIVVDRPRYGQALQYDMDLQCRVDAFPSPSIVWIRDGLELNNDQHYRISIFNTGDDLTDASLRIKSIERSQYGNFTCRAINKVGSDQRTVELFETENAICPPACAVDTN